MFDLTLDAGEYDRRVTLQAPTHSADAVGGPTATWAALATVWAKVRPLSGKEIERAQSIAVNPMMIVIRWRADVDATQRVALDDGRIGRVLWVTELGYRAELALAIEVAE